MTDDAFNCLPPHDVDAEACVLSAFMIEPAIRDEVAGRLRDGNAFFLPDHGILADALFDLHRRRQAVDAIILRDELKRRGRLDRIGGAAFLAAILAKLPTAAHWQEYLGIVERTRQQRWLIEQTDKIARRAHDDAIDPLAIVRDAATTMNRAVAAAANNAPPEVPLLALKGTIEDAIAGRLACLPFPWQATSELSQALRPGSLTVLSGAGGSSKSFWLLQAFTFWVEKNVPASLYALEDNLAFHLHRCLAQLSGVADLTSLEWIHDNPQVARRLMGEHTDAIDAIGGRIWTAPWDVPTLDEVGDWIRHRAEAGDRIICVDPITRARTSDRRHIDDERFVGNVARIAEDFGCSIICVTHPTKQAKGPPTLADIAGGAAWARFAQCILALRRLDPPRYARCIDPTANLPCSPEINAELWLLKARSGPGTGKRIGFSFQPEAGLTFHEHGVILPADAMNEAAT